MSFRYSCVTAGILAVFILVVTICYPVGATAVSGGAGGDTTALSRPHQGVLDRDTIAPNASLRIMAAGDRDPVNTSFNRTQLVKVNGSYRVKVVNRSPSGFPLDIDTYTKNRSARMAPEVDGYRTTLNNSLYVPYRNQWIALSNSRIGAIRITPLALASQDDDDTETDGVLASAAPQGEWYEVYNASVNSTDHGPQLTNPDAAMVNAGTHFKMADRERAAIQNISTARLESKSTDGAEALNVPIVEYRNTNGGGQKSVPTNISSQSPIRYHWKGESKRPIENHWIWLQSVSPGAWSPRHDEYILPSGEVQVRALTDFNASLTIPGYSETEQCSTGLGSPSKPVTYWESFTFEGYEVDNTVTIGNSTGRDYAGDGSPFGVLEVNATSAGSTQIQLKSTVNITYTHEYGVDHGCDPDWSRTETQVAQHEMTRSYPVAVVDTRSNITVYALDKPTQNEVYIESEPASFSITDYPMHTIRLATNGVDSTRKEWELMGPWRFYRLRSFDKVRLPNGTTENASLTYDPDRRYLWRDYVAAGNYRTLNNTASYTGHIRGAGASIPDWDRNVSTKSYDPRHPMATARLQSVTDHRGATTMYDWIGGAYTAPSDSAFQNLSATVTDVFGRTTNPTIIHRDYEPTRLRLRKDGTAIRARLHSNGTGVGGKTLDVDGGEVSSVSTNSTGWASFEATDHLVHVSYDGTPYNESHTTYYDKSAASVIIPELLYIEPVNVWSRIGRMLSNIGIIVEWIALGLFCLYMYRRKFR